MRIDLDLPYETKVFKTIEIIADIDIEISRDNSDVGISDGVITDIDIPVFYYNKTGDRCGKLIQRYLEKYFDKDDKLAYHAYKHIEARV